MNLRPLHTEEDYRAALAEVSKLVDLDPQPGTPDGNRLEILSILVEHYEGLVETAYLLASPANAAHLGRSIESLKGCVRKPAQPVSINHMHKATWRSLAETLSQYDEKTGSDLAPVTSRPMAEYEQDDFIQWLTEQAKLLRDGRLAEVDRNNVAEELDALARAMQRELRERLVRLLQNLLQWEYLSSVRLPAWYNAIQEERQAISNLLAEVPSLRNGLTTTYAEAWHAARERASDATGVEIAVFPRETPYSVDHAVDSAFWPESNDSAGEEATVDGRIDRLRKYRDRLPAEFRFDRESLNERGDVNARKLASGSGPANKLDGPLNRDRFTLKPVDPATLGDARLSATLARFAAELTPPSRGHSHTPLISPEAVAEVMSLQPVPHTVDELETRVREGLPMSALRACVARATESAGARQALLAQIIPEISNNHQGGTLSRVESEKTERVARVVATASYVWNDEAAVQGFLETPHPSLDGRIPLNVALTELGARRIEDLLWKLFYEKPV